MSSLSISLKCSLPHQQEVGAGVFVGPSHTSHLAGGMQV